MGTVKYIIYVTTPHITFLHVCNYNFKHMYKHTLHHQQCHMCIPRTTSEVICPVNTNTTTDTVIHLTRNTTSDVLHSPEQEHHQ